MARGCTSPTNVSRNSCHCSTSTGRPINEAGRCQSRSVVDDVRVVLTNTQEIMAVALQQKWVNNAVASGCVRVEIRSLVGRRHRMVRHEGGRWDVGIEDNAVYLERISESDEELFDDSLTPEEARQLAGLLTKYADKLDESEDSGDSDESDDSEDSEDSDDSDESDESDDSDDSDESDDSEESGESSD
jgi:hypothetical protein